MRIMFMGTPDFAEISLKALIEHNENVTCAVCQPDKPKGRKMELSAPPVKEYAGNLGITVYQPETLKDGKFQDILNIEKPELIVVVAYGKILPKYILDYPKYGCINLHGSILPKYRGSAPIQWTIINGDKYAGVTTMYMAESLDSGDIIDVYKTEVQGNETAGMLFDKLAQQGAILLCDTIDKIKNGTVKSAPQDDSLATFAPMLKKEMGQINFQKTANEIRNLVRGLNPWPVAYINTNKGVLKVYEASVISENSGNPTGTVLEDKNAFIVQTTDGCISFDLVQLQGKRIMQIDEVLRGHKIEIEE